MPERSIPDHDGGFRLAVLGPLTAWRDGARISLGPARQRAVLGLLALTPNVPVHRKAIIDALWGDDIPATAVHLVQVYLHRLRQLLGPGRLLTQAGASYELVAAGDQLDLLDFETHASRAAQADAADESGQACEAYARALGIWRAEPLADIEVLHAHPVVVALRQRHSDLVVRYARAAIAAGRHGEVTSRLRELTVAEPLNESAHAALMLALSGSGQQAAALTLFDDLRRRLDDQLGVRPGAEAADAQQRVLRQDVPRSAGGGTGQPPRQLPAAVPSFTGRAAELAALTQALRDGDQGQRPRIMTITGVAGVGKTALAVHWAHQAGRHFPDGQLYLNLRGFGPSGAPVAAADAIRAFLAALCVPAELIPATADAQAGLLRSLLAGKRMLVLLDNARDPAQVRPLLPGSPGCMVIITSRSWLAGLLATEGACQLSLEVLSQSDAAGLLASRLGTDRAAAEPAAVAELAALCAGLPVALVIAAARAIAQQHLPLHGLAAELRGAQTRLDALTTGDSATDVRSVFSWSYRNLSAPAARLFRQAGLHPGPSISAAAAASLAGMTPSAAGRALRELVSACLIHEHSPGRFALHDLLREYAAELAGSASHGAGTRAATRRLLDHYLHTALAARALLEPHQAWITPPAITAGVTLGRIAGHRDATDWFEAEHQGLTSAVTLAVRAGFDLHACQISVALASALDRSARWQDLEATSAIALAAAGRAGHREAAVYAQRGLAAAAARRGEYDESRMRLLHCLEQFAALGDTDGQARSHMNLAGLLHLMGDTPQAARHAHQACELFTLIGENGAGLAGALNTAGCIEALLGNADRGLAYCQQGLALALELDNRVIAAATWDSLGYVRYRLGQYQAAISCYLRAAAMFAELGGFWCRAEVLINLGEAHEAAGNRIAARELWREALGVFERTGHSGAEALRARIG